MGIGSFKWVRFWMRQFRPARDRQPDRLQRRPDGRTSTQRIDNIEVSRTSRDYPANCTADIPYPYAEVLTSNTSDVKTLVPPSAGVGKL